MRRRMMVGVRRRLRVGLVGHRCVIVIVVCDLMCDSGWRTDAHRRGSEAFERQRQQRYPDDQGFKDGFHGAILA
jgi:hypothetical protein